MILMTRIIQVDAFTDTRFRGNPAAVCVLEREPDATWMQAVANEMNLSETAFLWREAPEFRLRWFTPSTEVDLCGHATLASAHVLWSEGHLAHDTNAIFNTRSGRLYARKHGDWIELDFPSEPAESAVEESIVAPAVGSGVLGAWRNRMDILVQVGSENRVRELQPDLLAVAALDCRVLIVTSQSDDQRFDFVSRVFAPAVGVDEDPVTGSAHCFLGPFWAERLGKDSLVGYQASARGGVVRVDVRSDRVGLGGQAVTVLEGRLLA
jgi:predicted PhzF superfamily epimerase YddE/YHI9